MDDARAGRSIDFKEIVELTKWAAEGVCSEGTGMFAATQEAGHDRYTFGHSVNVFLIATTLLQPFARNRQELARFSQAALLHDVGKSLVPSEILHKQTRLTMAEKRIV